LDAHATNLVGAKARLHRSQNAQHIGLRPLFKLDQDHPRDRVAEYTASSRIKQSASVLARICNSRMNPRERSPALDCMQTLLDCKLP
jgi:hypothetical protein